MRRMTGTRVALMASLVLTLTLPAASPARGRRGGSSTGWYTSRTSYSQGDYRAYYYAPSNAATAAPEPARQSADVDRSGGALAEVNATRAAAGLPPFVEDAELTKAAQAAADYRAAHGIEGHTSNDFAFLPASTWARAAGCAAWPDGMGWGSCCTYESWQYAGAAAVKGRDGRRYMHLFVR